MPEQRAGEGHLTWEQWERVLREQERAFQRQQYQYQQLGGLWGALGLIVAPAPPVPRAPETGIEAAPEEEAGMALVNDFLVGCDPEFVVLDGGKLVNVAAAIGPVGRVGHDHGGDVVEVRPEPAKGTFTLLKRIQALLLGDAKKKLPQAKWRAGAMVRFDQTLDPVMERDEWGDPVGNAQGGVRYFGENLQELPQQPAYQAPAATRPRRRARITLGGHVHLGLSPYLKKLAPPEMPMGMRAITDAEWEVMRPMYMGNQAELAIREGANVGHLGLGDVQYIGRPQPAKDPAHEARIAALDHLTRRLEALDILPHAECESRRGGGEYGRFGDVRIDKLVSGDYKTEYRTMASWLYDPRVAMLCLTAAKLAAADPAGAIQTLGRFHDFAPLKKWFEGFAGKDFNAKQVVEKILSKGLKAIQTDPDVDFKTRWEGALL